jgi:hypothetical protein
MPTPGLQFAPLGLPQKGGFDSRVQVRRYAHDWNLVETLAEMAECKISGGESPGGTCTSAALSRRTWKPDNWHDRGEARGEEAPGSGLPNARKNAILVLKSGEYRECGEKRLARVA